MKQTHTYALLYIPPRAHELILESLRELGQDHRIHPDLEGDEGPTTGLSMEGIMLVPDVEENRDLLNSGDVSDLAVAIGEDAFISGFKACSQWFNQPYDAQAGHAAWSNYDPHETLKGAL